MSQDYNKIITTLNSITNDYTFIPDISNVIVIDTSNNRIGINTEDPSYSIHVVGSSNAIKTPNLIVDTLTLKNGNIQGNLGIGTALDPSFILSVGGPCKMYKFVSMDLSDVDGVQSSIIYNSDLPTLQGENLTFTNILKYYTLKKTQLDNNMIVKGLNGINNLYLEISGIPIMALDSNGINIQSNTSINIINDDSTISTGIEGTFACTGGNVVTVKKGIITDVS